MRSASTADVYTPSRPAEATLSPRSFVLARLGDYLELTKPRIAMLALVTVTVGFVLGSRGNWQFAPLLHALLGVGLVAAGSSALNQYVERAIDSRMARTMNRPLPAGRLLPWEALWFGLFTATLGTGYLAIASNLLTAALALATCALYVAVYTPLKQRSSLCTAVGAVPGALPPVLGWTAAAGSLDWGAFALFAILFLWQFPHFLAIAWLYRRDYADGGLKMLPAASVSRHVTGGLGVAYALALLPVSLLPREFGMASTVYSLAALFLGLAYVAAAGRFMLREHPAAARGLLWTSLIYLPALLLVLTWDHVRLLV